MGLFDCFRKKASHTQATPEHILQQADALVNQFEDNIPFFFEGYAEGVENRQSAMIV
ncbi:hypothetical protein [Chitinophaga sp.]|uniref:hypothetical protein n=1 Tax=Chitinophaga sp. TaxID=1869181 RepID=UPI0031D7574E